MRTAVRSVVALALIFQWLNKARPQEQQKVLDALGQGVNDKKLNAKWRSISIAFSAETVEHLTQHWIYLQGCWAVEAEMKNKK